MIEDNNLHDSEPFTRYQFNLKRFLVLFLGLFGCLFIPLLYYFVGYFPSDATSGSRITIIAGVAVVALGLWVILYRKTRPTDHQYRLRRNLIGRGFLFLALLLSIVIFFVSYYWITSNEFEYLTLSQYLTNGVNTPFDLTLLQIWTDFGTFLSQVRFQVLFSLVYVGIAFLCSPHLRPEAYNKLRQKVSLSAGVVIVWVLICIILIGLGIGYIWVGTEGRDYLIWGLYDQQFSIELLPNLVFLIFGAAFYLGSRMYFWSDPEENIDRRIAWGCIILEIVGFNLLWSLSPSYPEFLFENIAIPYIIYLLLNTLVSIGIILLLQANIAVMGGKPGRKIRILGILFTILFIIGVGAFLSGYLIQDKGISFQFSQVVAYFPNVIFSGFLTYAIFHLTLWIQNHLKKDRVPQANDIKEKGAVEEGKVE